MNADDFEQQLRRRPIRPLPPEWRDEILDAAVAAGQSGIANPASRIADYPSRVPWWRELLWPCPQAWAGLAAVWVVILALNASSSDGPPVLAAKPQPPPPEIRVALREQRRLLAELIGPAPVQVEPPEKTLPRPRGEGRRNIRAA